MLSRRPARRRDHHVEAVAGGAGPAQRLGGEQLLCQPSGFANAAGAATPSPRAGIAANTAAEGEEARADVARPSRAAPRPPPAQPLAVGDRRLRSSCSCHRHGGRRGGASAVEDAQPREARAVRPGLRRRRCGAAAAVAAYPRLCADDGEPRADERRQVPSKRVVPHAWK